MEESSPSVEDLSVPPARLFERLAQLPGYTWDQSIEPFHSTYNNWHVYGIRHSSDSDVATSTAFTSSGRSSSARNSPKFESRPAFRHRWRSSLSLSESSSDVSVSRGEGESAAWIPVVARIGTNVVRLEREYHMIKSIIQVADPECKHTVRPIDLVRISSSPNESSPLVALILESSGPNYLRELVTFGPAFYGMGSKQDGSKQDGSQIQTPGEQVPLSTFLDFAIGACECIELLHYGLRNVHGEIRGDAFHFNRETGAVKLTNTGNGARAFDNALSEGWPTLSREVGVKNKLQFIAPEQTGRLPTEPDSRTDIYTLGVLFWAMLVGKPAFDGSDPVEVVQNVLAKRLALVTSKRMDVPDALSAVIDKMTQKQMEDRYHTISSVKSDLQQIAQLLGDGEIEELRKFVVAKRDVSSFFSLPSTMFGRREEHDKIVRVIERAQKRQQSAFARGLAKSKAHNLYTISSNGSSASDNRLETFDIADASSDSGSFGIACSRTSTMGPYHNGHSSSVDQGTTTDTGSPVQRAILPSGRAKASVDSRFSGELADHDSHLSTVASLHSQPSSQMDSLGPLLRRRNSHHKFRRIGRTELITISGGAGIGKSDLVLRVQPTVRRYGYMASSRLDRARRIPFEPFMKVLGNFLRQIFSERDVTTEYHNNLRATLRPVWPMLHKLLELPEKLIAHPGGKEGDGPKTSLPHHMLNEAKGDPPHDKKPMKNGFSSLSRGQSINEFLKASPSTNLRFTDILIEILRVLSSFKLICICLDDIQYADDESLNLIVDIINANVGCVLVLTFREDEMMSTYLASLLHNDNVSVTRIDLGPLAETEILHYVAATMHQEANPSLLPLAAVVQEKSQGNPFYIRMMLETCYNKNCIWYSWRNSSWEYDLDRIFTEFVSPNYGQGLGTEFIAKRLQEIPSAARSILLWASLLGSPFSFSLVQRLLSGEFLFNSEEDTAEDITCPKRAMLQQSEANIVIGLQHLLQTYIILPGDTDDEYRFAHDRFAQAVASMKECHNQSKMHFIIAQTMMKYSPSNGKDLYSRASHICHASKLIKSRVGDRIKYRDVLYQAAVTAHHSSARPTSLWFFQNCMFLLQDNPWDEEARDVYYDETRQLFVETAEMLWYQGQDPEALSLLSQVFDQAKGPACKSKAWILKSRIHTESGDQNSAKEALFTSLSELGIHLREAGSWEECDTAYENLTTYLRQSDVSEIVSRPLSDEQNLIAIGNVMSEAMSVAFWGDALMFFRMALDMMKIYLFRGAVPQVSLGCAHLAMVAMSRFKDLQLATILNRLSISLLNRYQEPWTQNRGRVIHNLFFDHLCNPIRNTLPTLESTMEMTSSSGGDRYITLGNISAMAFARLYLGQDMAELESFCAYSVEHIKDWMDDLRAGTMLLSVRQVARALQGHTFVQSGDHVLSDDQHDTTRYMEHIAKQSGNPARPRDIYYGLAMLPLYLYGHHEKAVEVGLKILETIQGLWSIRITILIYFYLSLSILSLRLENPSRPHLQEDLETAKKYKAEVDFARSACDANYGMWSLLLEALICELEADYASAIQLFEAAIDHSQVHGWPLEEALAFEMHGDFLVRRGAKRAARAVMQDAVAAWRSISATGKAKQLAEKHEWLLKTATSSRCNDVGCQTADSLLDVNRVQDPEDTLAQPHFQDERNQNWLHQTERPSGENSMDISGVGLDIIDLTTILEFSQVISSELQIDKLLTKMVEVILESCGGSEYAIIVTEFESLSWRVAAAGDHEKGLEYYTDGLPFSEVEDKIAQRIAHYSLRTREEVLVHNVLEDERFSNVGEAYLARNPGGRSVITLPIVQADTLLGVMHLEGKPNSFTQRNLVVLHLLCNQVGISLANALLFRQVRKISASNAAMVESQKRALAQARESEQKAKIAEAEAKHNVKLKEEAAKAKSIFLANVSHDLRTPMNGVIGLSELLKQTKLDSQQDGYVESIRVCADTLLTLINDILDFSKLEAGKMKLSTVPLNLKETITEVVRALRFTHRDRGLETIEELDQVNPKLLVLGDPVRLHQIFMNLLSNSYKFTPKGSVTVKAQVTREGKGRVRLTCAVSDTGIGISSEQMSRLFRPFSQADNSTARSYGGSGLGLSICKAIIEDVLGGKIWLESSPGVGTTVTFTLVFDKAPKDSIVKAPWSHDFVHGRKDVTVATRTHRDLLTIPRSEIRVCIAEDNPINQKIAVTFVKNLGLKSEAYSDGQQAVEALRLRSKEGNPFHLVLMDVQMPVLDGYNATRAIRKDPDPNVNEVLVIAMTASAIEGDREKCIDAGMNNYLAKPVRSEVLKTMLDQYLAPLSRPARGQRLGSGRSITRVDEVGETKSPAPSPGFVADEVKMNRQSPKIMD